MNSAFVGVNHADGLIMLPKVLWSSGQTGPEAVAAMAMKLLHPSTLRFQSCSLHISKAVYLVMQLVS